MTTKYGITNQRNLRQSFWEAHPQADRRKGRDGDYLTDTRVAFVDYVDMLCRSGHISPELAQRATLRP